MNDQLDAMNYGIGELPDTPLCPGRGEPSVVLAYAFGFADGFGAAKAIYDGETEQNAAQPCSDKGRQGLFNGIRKSKFEELCAAVQNVVEIFGISYPEEGNSHET